MRDGCADHADIPRVGQPELAAIHRSRSGLRAMALSIWVDAKSPTPVHVRSGRAAAATPENVARSAALPSFPATGGRPDTWHTWLCLHDATPVAAPSMRSRQFFWLPHVGKIPDVRRGPQPRGRINGIGKALPAKHDGFIVSRGACERMRPTLRSRSRSRGVDFTRRNANAERRSERLIVRSAPRRQTLILAMRGKTFAPRDANGPQHGCNWPGRGNGGLTCPVRLPMGLAETWCVLRVP